MAETRTYYNSVRIRDIHHSILGRQRLLDAQNMSRITIWLVSNSQIREAARNILAPLALGIRNVIKLEVVAHPTTTLARVDEVHRVRGREGKLATRRLDKRPAFLGRDKLVSGSDGATEGGSAGSTDAVLEVGVGVVADVVGAGGAIDLEEGDGAAVGGDADADVVAVNGRGPVGYAVDVDFAAENSHRGRVLVVRGDADGFAAADGRDDGGRGKGSGREAQCGHDVG